MYFTVLPPGTRIPSQATSKSFLVEDNWDGWFKFSTLYSLLVFDEDGERHSLGGVKIGQFEMADDQRRPALSRQLDPLDEQFFSLGQDDSYYGGLNDLGGQSRVKILRSLRDVWFDLELFERALEEKVTGTSLLRSVTRATVVGQFHRMAQGGARLTEYEFSYTAPRRARQKPAPLTLSFTVAPESFPPTNVHVLIGRNGVGKTTLLNNMTRAIVEGDPESQEFGSFSADDSDESHSLFTSLVSVTFSAFDPFDPLPTRQDKSKGMQYALPI